MSIIPVMKKGNRLPIFRARLMDPGGGPAPLAGASTVWFSMRNQDTGQTVIFRAPATVVNAAQGEVAFHWRPGDTNVPGTYEAEWVVTYPGGLEMTYPGDGFNGLQIVDGIDAATP